ncbi:MAG: TetR/AcrR family transcriptional regulator [Myxococcota bacterium]
MATDDNEQVETDRKPGRPRSFEEEAALDAAIAVFWDKGFGHTTTRELQSATGLSPSSMSNTFGSKRALLESAVERYEARAVDELVVPLEASEEGLTAIKSFYDALVEWVTDDEHRGCLIINLMAEYDDSAESVASRWRAYRTRVRSALRGALERAVAAGELESSGLSARVELLFGLVLGVNIAARGGTPRAEVARLRDAVHAQIDGWRTPSHQHQSEPTTGR